MVNLTVKIKKCKEKGNVTRTTNSGEKDFKYHVNGISLKIKKKKS